MMNILYWVTAELITHGGLFSRPHVCEHHRLLGGV